MKRTWMHIVAIAALALAATATLTLTAACTDDAPSSEPTGAPEEGHVQQADNAAAYARARALGCTFLEGGAVRCPEHWVLNGNTYFPSVEDMPAPRKPRRLEDLSAGQQNLVEVGRRALANPDAPGIGRLGSPEYSGLNRFMVENYEAEFAMARAGCETMEDACADAVRARLGWNGMQSPGTLGMEAFYEARAARIEAQRERLK